jgi:hypothetical protein
VLREAFLAFGTKNKKNEKKRPISVVSAVFFFFVSEEDNWCEVLFV